MAKRKRVDCSQLARVISDLATFERSQIAEKDVPIERVIDRMWADTETGALHFPEFGDTPEGRATFTDWVVGSINEANARSQQDLDEATALIRAAVADLHEQARTLGKLGGKRRPTDPLEAERQAGAIERAKEARALGESLEKVEEKLGVVRRNKQTPKDRPPGLVADLVNEETAIKAELKRERTVEELDAELAEEQAAKQAARIAAMQAEEARIEREIESGEEIVRVPRPVKQGTPEYEAAKQSLLEKRVLRNRVEGRQKRLAELRAALAEGRLVERDSKGRPQETNPAMIGLNEAVKVAEAAYKASDPAIRDHYAPIMKRLAEKLAAIKSKTFVPPVSQEDVPGSDELFRLEYETKKLRNAVRGALEDAKPKNLWVKHVDPFFDASRAWMTAFDVSGVGRQAGPLLFMHPLKAWKNLMPMFRALKSEADFNRYMGLIDAHKWTPRAVRDGLAITNMGPGSTLDSQEEVYMGRVGALITKITGKATGFSQRAYVLYLNKMRIDMYAHFVETWTDGNPTLEEGRAIANWVNILTGRGGLAHAEGAARALTRVFFAPRLVASRFQLLTMPLRLLFGDKSAAPTPRIRKMILQGYARYMMGAAAFYGSAASLLGLAYGSGGGEDGEEDDGTKPWGISMNPTSTDFGKLRINNTRIDPLGGIGQVLVLSSRILSGRSTTIGGETRPIQGPIVEGEDGRSRVDTKFGQADRYDVMTRFLRTKFSPLMSTISDIPSIGRDPETGEWRREYVENVVGQPVTWGGLAWERVWPLALSEVKASFQDLGVPATVATTIASIFGLGVAVYQNEAQAHETASPR